MVRWIDTLPEPDDVVELLAKDDAVEVRSISRLGESDLGVNAQRVALLRDRLR